MTSEAPPPPERADVVPVLRQVVLDTTDARALAEFYRELLDLRYAPGDEPPAPGAPDPHGAEWLVLCEQGGRRVLGFQQVEDLPVVTWPDGPHPQMLHLDTAVDSLEALGRAGQRALALGARVIDDRSDDDEEPLVIYADPSGHPFCIFVADG